MPVHPISALRAARRGIARGLYAIVRTAAPVAYGSDGLIGVHAHAFMRDPAFIKAYAHGVTICALPTGQGLLIRPPRPQS